MPDITLSILIIFRSQVLTVLSWGFHDAIPTQDGIRFYTDGFLHKGLVEVSLNYGKDLFEVRLFNADGSLKSLTEDVYCDELVEVIDRLVERCQDYEERVSEEYHIIKA